MDLDVFQKNMGEVLTDFDRESGPFFLMTVLAAEVGELASSVKNDDKEGVSEELADLVFTAVSIANLYGLNLSESIKKKYLETSVEEVLKKWKEPYVKNRLEDLKKR